MRLGKYLSSLTKPELEELKNICNFTDEELKILDCLVKEKSYEEISSYKVFYCNGRKKNISN